MAEPAVWTTTEPDGTVKFNFRIPEGRQGDPGPAGPNTVPTNQAIADAVHADGPAKTALYVAIDGQALTGRRVALGRFRAAASKSHAGPVNVVGAGSSSMEGYNATAEQYRMFNRLAAILQAEYPSGLGTETTPRTVDAGYNALHTGPGLHFYNGGEGGTRSDSYLPQARVDKIAAIDPAIIFHMVGANDGSGNVAPATYKANMLDALARVDAATPGNPVHVLIHQFQRWDQWGSYAWTEYRDQLKAIADADPSRFVFIDLNPAYVALGIPNTDPLNLIDTDNIHQNNAGHELMADLLRKELGLPGQFELASYYLGMLDTMTRVNGAVTAAASAAASAAATVLDTFDRADGPLGAATTGQVWTVESGTFAISGNKVVCTAFGNAFIETGKTNLDLTVKITHDGTGHTPGVLFRALGAADRLGVFIEPTSGVRLAITKGGTATFINGTGTVTAAQHTIRVTVVGKTITVYFNGVVSITHTLSDADAAYFANATKAGIRIGSIPGTPGISWDDLTVKVF